MPYNPKIHHRKSIRLKGYDYSQEGMYYVTICVQNRQCLFGKILGGKMILNEYGEIACGEWEKLPEQHHNVSLDVFQIMPNHMHGIIVLQNVVNTEKFVGATLAAAQNNNADTKNHWAGASPAPTIIGAYKSLVAHKCLEIYKSRNEYMGKLWQRNYYERIIRDEQTYKNIANYIINNPANWKNP